MTASNPQGKSASFHVASFAGGIPAVAIAAVDADNFLRLRLNRMKMSFHRMAAVSAIGNGIQVSPHTYAVWARLDDGGILGLHQIEGIWHLTRVPLCPASMVSLNLPPVTQARAELLWIEVPINPIEPAFKILAREPTRQLDQKRIVPEIMPSSSPQIHCPIDF